MAATQTVPQTVSPVVPFQASPQHSSVETISQFELLALLGLRSRLSQLSTEIEKAEASVLARLEAGAMIEPGAHTASAKVAFRRNVSWKSVVIRLATRFRMNGAAYCARVLTSTQPTRTVSLVIE
jgi:hypothetical protein